MKLFLAARKARTSFGAKFAKEHNIKLTEFLPDWETHGEKAGFIRNEDIIKNADMVLSFGMGSVRHRKIPFYRQATEKNHDYRIF